MGFQWRKRTNGKDGWLNFSHSKKNGLRGSASFKPSKNTTVNLSRDGVRFTLNLGGGLKYVKTIAKAKPKKTVKESTKSIEHHFIPTNDRHSLPLPKSSFLEFSSKIDPNSRNSLKVENTKQPISRTKIFFIFVLCFIGFQILF